MSIFDNTKHDMCYSKGVKICTCSTFFLIIKPTSTHNSFIHRTEVVIFGVILFDQKMFCFFFFSLELSQCLIN